MFRAIASFAYRFGLLGTLASTACSAGGAESGSPTEPAQAGTGSGSGGSLAVGGSSSGGTGNFPPLMRSCGMAACTDFPEEPLTDGDPPENAAALFGDPSNMVEGSLCLFEPQDGTLFPVNWIRPRFRFTAAGGEDLFEIRLRSGRQRHDLVVYTTKTLWTMPQEIWTGLAHNAFGESVEVIVRGLDTDEADEATPTGASAKFTIAPVYAGGSMVYWAANGSYGAGGKTWLVGFGVGEEGTVDALTPEQVQEFPVLDEAGLAKPAETYGGVTYDEGRVRCIGCHASTPDGGAVAFTDSWPWNSVIASVRPEDAGARPDYVSEAGALMALQPWLGAPAFSPAHWTDGDRIMITSFGNPTGAGWPGPGSLSTTNKDRLAWIDLGATASVPSRESSGPEELNAAIAELEGTAFGFLERTGDPRAAVNPTWSHDGKTIAYTSVSLSADGHAGGSQGTPIQSDIYVVPYNDRKGGAAMPLLGAANPTAVEYYPDFSPDDKFIAFTRAPATSGRVYYRPDGEVFVIPAEGGMARRLVANDPPACSGETSPGVINSWPKWAPGVSAADGNTYYWLIFSSGRSYPEQFEAPRDDYSPPDTRSSQLYMAGIVVQDGQIISDHPAVYIWNQSKDTTNLTPAWDDFLIPVVK